jgi:23S rRNA (uridine2552-2'-O)-methyltransferase
MGKTRSGQKYNPKDAYFKAAKLQGFVARSAFKLEEMDKRWRFLKPGMSVLDLGCAPGSWLQYSSRKVGPKGKLLGVDIEPVRVDLPNVKTVVGDLTRLKAEDPIFADYKPFDFVQSDAMVKTVGISDSDCARSVALVESALALAEQVLKPGGGFVAKVFEGPGFTEFYVVLKRKFGKTYVSKPEAVREGSREVYVVALGFKG